MTWTKLSDDFGVLAAKAGLSDAAFRLHVEALIWAMARENGGRLDRIDLRRFAETADPELAAAELVAAGYWDAAPDGCWQVVEHLAHQPEPDVIAVRRKRGAARVRKHRRKAAGLSDLDTAGSVTHDVTLSVTRYPGRDGSGRDGENQTTKAAPTENACEACGKTSGWSLLARGDGAMVCRSCKVAA